MKDYKYNVFYLCSYVLYDGLEKRRLFTAFSAVLVEKKEEFSNGKKQFAQQPSIIRTEWQDV